MKASLAVLRARLAEILKAVSEEARRRGKKLYAFERANKLRTEIEKVNLLIQRIEAPEKSAAEKLK